MGDSFHLSTADLAALAFFLLAWVLHTLASDGKLVSRVSLTMAMNVQREAWMRTMAEREIRIVDTAIMSGLQQGTAFFASSSLIASPRILKPRSRNFSLSSTQPAYSAPMLNPPKKASAPSMIAILR